MSTDRSQRHGVIVLLTDAPEDVSAARYAARLAAEQGTRVLAAVVLPSSGPTLDAALVSTTTARRRAEAAAVSARVLPTMQALDVALTPVPLLLSADRWMWSPLRLRRALRILVRHSGAQAVVVPPRPLLGQAPQDVAALVPGGVVAPDALGRSDEPLGAGV